MHAGAASGIDAEAKAGRADGVEIEHAAETLRCRPRGNSMRMDGRGLPGLRIGQALEALQAPVSRRLAAFSIQPVTLLSAGPPCVGFILEAASSGGCAPA